MSVATHPTTAVVDTAGHRLRADAAGSYLRMLAAGMPAGGIDVFTRTLAEQEARYQAYLHGGPLAARPTPNAPHVKGLAMDFHTTTGSTYTPSPAYLWAVAGGNGKSKPIPGEKLRSHDYGWSRTVPSERWHFGYDPAHDKRRAADLAARVKALGYGSTKAFQKAHGLADDGVDGPLTWGALLNNPTPATPDPIPDPIPEPEPVGAVDFRAASYNMQAKRFGGGGYSADTAFAKEVLRPSVLLLQESDETARDAMRLAMGFKVWPHNYLGVLFDPAKYDHGGKLTLSFDDHGVQGAVATKLTSTVNGQSFVACSVHIRPNDAIPGSATQKLAGKHADVGDVIKFLAPYPNVVVGGDWSTEHARALMLAAGYRQVTPNVDTYKTSALDAVYVKGTITDRTGGSTCKTPASDHRGLVANLTLHAPIPTN